MVDCRAIISSAKPKGKKAKTEHGPNIKHFKTSWWVGKVLIAGPKSPLANPKKFEKKF